MKDLERKFLDGLVGFSVLILSAYVSFCIFESVWLWLLIYTFIMVLYYCFLELKKSKKMGLINKV